MSFKNFACTVTAIVLMAAPAFAVPSFNVVSGGVTGGNQVWNVLVGADPLLFDDLPAPNPTTVGSVALEMGFQFNGVVLTAVRNASFWNVEDDNPGNNPFTNTETAGVSIHSNFSGTIDGIFAALGSELFTNGTQQLALTITTQGVGGTLSWGGQSINPVDGAPDYIGGRLAQEGLRFDNISGSLMIPGTLLPVPGDANNDRVVDVFDFDSISQNFGSAGGPFDGLKLGDANDNGVVDVFDFDSVAQNFGNTGGALGAGAVPEPSTVVLAGIGLALAGFAARRRIM